MNLLRLFQKSPSFPRTVAGRLRFRPQVEGLESRLVPYTTSGNMWPNPQLVTISFMPDGTSLGTATSNLFSTFNAKFGSAAAWENVILKAAQVWAQQTNLNLAVVPDSGAPEGSGGYQQGDPTMGDIRIGGCALSSSTLALAYLPPPVNNYSLAGDMTFNTSQTFNINGQDYDLMAVAMHEFGHAFGMLGSSTISAAMYETYSGAKSGLNADDVNGIRSIYSNGTARAPDAFGSVNNSFANAANVNYAVSAGSLTALVPNLDITTAGEKDYYTLTAPAGTGGTVTVSVQSQGLSLLAPKVSVYSAGQALLGTASGSGKYGTTLTLNLANKISAGQQFYVQVTGADTTALGTGAYALSLSFAGNPLPTQSSRAVPVSNGSPLSGGGGLAQAQDQPYQVSAAASGSQQAALQSPQAVAMDARGDHVVTWAANDGTGGPWTIYAQRFTATGVPLGGQFQVNTYSQSDTEYPAVAMDAAGDFVITWSAQGEDGAGWGVYAQRYDAAGVPQGGEFQVNTTTTNDQMYPAAAMDKVGNFVITWSGDDQYPQSQNSGGILGGLVRTANAVLGGNQPVWNVYGQRYNAAGTAQGGQFQVNTYTQGEAEHSTIAADAAGDFVITWSDDGEDGSGWGVYARRYSAAGAAQGGEFRVNTTTAGDQLGSTAAMDATGDFVITWTSAGGGQPGSSGRDVYAQRYNAAGTALGGEFLVNTTAAGDQQSAAVAMNATGDFLITWSSNGGGQSGSSGWDVYARQYSADGGAEGNEFPVNTATAGDQNASAVARDSEGHIVVVWESSGTNAVSGIFAQRYVIGGDALSVPDDGQGDAPAAGPELANVPGLPPTGRVFTPTASVSAARPEQPRAGGPAFDGPKAVSVPSSAGPTEAALLREARDAWFVSDDWLDVFGN